MISKMTSYNNDSLENVERVTSGIPGLDDFMEGGFVKGSTNLLAGHAGTCKTIFSCQYILEGITKGENGLYMTLGESANSIINDVSRFGWNFRKHMKEGECKIVEMKSIDLRELIAFIAEEVKAIDASRFVLDSLSIASMSWKGRPEEEFKLRMDVFDLIKSLKDLDVTSILVSEIERGKEYFGKFGFEEFLVDGVMVLQLLTTDVTMRSVQITKMRRTDHSFEINPFSVTNKGIVINKM